MKQAPPLPDNFDPVSASPLTHTPVLASQYEPPAIIHRGVLETRAGSPLINNPFGDPADPNNPLNK